MFLLQVVLVLELMPGGDIQELLHDVKQLSEAQVRLRVQVWALCDMRWV